MNHQVLLVSADAALAARVRRALPTHLPFELHCLPDYQPAPDGRGWLLLLLDSRAGGAATLAAAHPPSEAPLLWLEEGYAAAEPPCPRPRQLTDCLPRQTPPSMLAFILHQHLTAAYLQRMRSLPTSPTTALLASFGRDELQCQINNTLTGLLGNAQLATQLAQEAGRRLPSPLARRLERISELATQMRDLLLALPHAEGTA